MEGHGTCDMERIIGGWWGCWQKKGWLRPRLPALRASRVQRPLHPHLHRADPAQPTECNDAFGTWARSCTSRQGKWGGAMDGWRAQGLSEVEGDGTIIMAWDLQKGGWREGWNMLNPLQIKAGIQQKRATVFETTWHLTTLSVFPTASLSV
eukprot:4103159-Pyramimonas_sp.AAC.1